MGGGGGAEEGVVTTTKLLHRSRHDLKTLSVSNSHVESKSQLRPANHLSVLNVASDMLSRIVTEAETEDSGKTFVRETRKKGSACTPLTS